MEISQEGPVTTLTLPLETNSRWGFSFLLSSDRHQDNPKADNRLAKKHLDQLKEKNGLLLDLGDLICGMQGRNDRRGTKNDVKASNQSACYYDTLVNDAVDFFEPYKDNLALMAMGNHESAILKNNETDLTQRIVDRLNDKGSSVVNGGMRGWLRIRFHGSSHRHQVLIYYHHGYGGGGPVTRGAINTNRMAVYLPDADIIASGHIHEEWEMTIPRARIGHTGKEYQDEQLHICLPTYKQEFIDCKAGFHHEKGRGPKPLGAKWLHFYYENDRVKFKTERAK